MGRLRGNEDFNFLSGVAAEVTELFGAEGILFRHNARQAENLAGKDPLWDEPNTTVKYQGFRIPLFWNSREAVVNSIAQGRDDEADADVWISYQHLVAAGVPIDEKGMYVSQGDAIQIFTGCGEETIEFDILQVNRDGWINDTDKYSQYTLEVKRRDKYIPERKTQ